MPRHRRERVPLHRAQRSADDAARGVPMTAVFADADAEATLPMRLLQIGVASPSVVAAAVRGLLATPWFAAATGFVVAAGLWIYSPHAELKFPASKAGVLVCGASGCALPSQSGAPGATKKAPVQNGGGTSAAIHAARATVGRLKFTYQVLSLSDGKFAVKITVLGRRAPRQWTLALTMPGDQITRVLGAGWTSASHGAEVIATTPTASEALQGPGHGDGTPSTPIPPRRGFTFVVFADGSPGPLTDCTFNGVPCSFSASTG